MDGRKRGLEYQVRARQAAGAETRVRRIAVVGALAAVLCVVLCAAPAPALAIQPNKPVRADPSNKGLGPRVAVPAWAVHQRVHFFRSARSESPLSGGLSGQAITGGVDSNLGQVFGTDRPLEYWNGAVQHSPHVYVIFWGSKWSEAAGSALRAQLLKMYEGLSGSGYQGILTQYFDANGRVPSTVTVTSYTDTGVTAPTSVEDKKIREEAAKAITANNWPRELNSQFVVVPAPGATYEAGFARFCAYHGLVEESESSHDYTYTLVPDVAEEPFYSKCVTYDKGKVANNVTSMVASHEYAESATDPALNAWFTERGYEIGDICASGDDEIIEGSLKGSWVQGEWDDHQSACSLSDPLPPHVFADTESPEYTGGPYDLTLRGDTDAEGSETKYRFEYGSTTSYGSSVPVPDGSAGSGMYTELKTQNIAGLPEGIYHYRIEATNSTGTTYGEDRMVVSPGFSVEVLPQRAGESDQEREVEAVSCTSSAACIAVGQYYGKELHFLTAVAETWNGTAWSAALPPNPSGAAPNAFNEESDLLGVSCTSATACTAVGAYYNSSGTLLTLAERWNGTEWQPQTTPNPSESTESKLLGVSCPSSTTCVAVGYQKTPSGHDRTLTEEWTGGTWSIRNTTEPGEATESKLSGVSCSSVTECTSVGYYKNSAGAWMTLAERLNSGSWSIQGTQNPSRSPNPMTGATESYLVGVSCAASNACTAVGYAGWERTTLAEYWNGGEWSIQSTPNPSGALASKLSGVSCSSPTACTAVGVYATNSAPRESLEVLGEHWNGTTWTMSGMPTPSVEMGGFRAQTFDGVSCTKATTCVVVGAYVNSLRHYSSVAEREYTPPTATTEAASGVSESGATLNGTVGPEGRDTHYHFEYGTTTSYGTSVPVPEADAGSSAPTVKVSQAVTGLSRHTTYHFRLVATNSVGTTYGTDETVRIHGWESQSTPNPAEATESHLQGVSCSSPTACTGVGRYYKAKWLALAERWNGTEWSIQSTAPNGLNVEQRLESVWCRSSTECVAVGYEKGTGSQYWTLAERWNGTAWSTLSTPNPTGASVSVLAGVSCYSGYECMAVGYYENSAGAWVTLAERWNGTEWSILSTPNPTGATASYLTSVGCRLATASCSEGGVFYAVGHYINSSGTEVTLVEKWNGTAWSLESSPNPAGAKASSLQSVSCATYRPCEAVGHYINSSGVEVMLAETGPEWSIQSTPNPTGAVRSTLHGVSCQSLKWTCTAVGSYTPSSGPEVTLAERWNGVEWSVQPTVNPLEGKKKSALDGVSCASTGTECTEVEAVGEYEVSLTSPANTLAEGAW
jgi:hypothetical protein